MNLQEFREEFPCVEHRSYLFAGAISPACKSVLNAATQILDEQRDDPLAVYDRGHELAGDLRAELRALINGEVNRIALTENASRASALAIRLLDRRSPGGNIVVDSTAYPSSIYTWLTHGDHRIREVTTKPNESQGAAVGRILGAVDEDTAAVVVSHVCPLTGYRHDIEGLGAALRTTSTALFVDASQSVGAVEIDVRAAGVDVLVGTSMKWLLGTPGVGFLYVSPEFDDGTVMLDVGYASVVDQGGLWPRSHVPPPVEGLQRLEVGMPAIVPIVAATAGISLIRRVGVDVIERRVVELAHQVITCCVDAGLDPITPDASASHAGVVAVRTPRAVEIASMGRRSGVDVGGYPWGLLRIDPHAYVVDADVRRLQEVFASVL